MDAMEKHAALQNAFMVGALDEIEKIAEAEGLSDMEKMAILGWLGSLLQRGAAAGGKMLGQSGRAAHRAAVKATPSGGLVTKELEAVKGVGRGRQAMGRKLEEAGELIGQNQRLAGGLALGGAGLGAGGLATGAALS